MKNYSLDQLLGGLRSTESSGRYDALGPVTKTGDRAYGAYQVMGANVPNWTKEVLGNAMTPQQFLNDQKAQDAVARAKFGGYLQGSTPQDAISMWFSGKPLAQAGNASDGYMKTPDYVNKVLNFAANEQPTTTPGMAVSDAQPQQPLQEQTLVPGTQQEDRYSGVGPALANIGSIVAGLDRHRNNGLVAGLANTADNLVAQQRLNQQNKGLRVLDTTDKGMITQDPNTGEIKMMPLPAGYAKNTLEYKGLDTDKNGQTFDTFLDRSTGQIIRKPTNMVDPSMKANDDVTLSPEAISSAAKRVIGGEKGVLTRMSKGNAARIAEEIAAQTGEDPGQILANQNAAMGKAAEARTIGTSVGKSAVSAGTFESGVTNALEASKLVGRGQFVPFNQIDQLVRQNASDPNVLDFKAAHQTLIREYAKAINPNGNPTVSDMNHARELLSTATDEPAYERVVKRLQSEVKNKQENLEKLNGGRKTIREDSTPSQPKRLKYNPATGELE